jgi:hypothetical protein
MYLRVSSVSAPPLHTIAGEHTWAHCHASVIHCLFPRTQQGSSSGLTLVCNASCQWGQPNNGALNYTSSKDNA